MLTCTRNITKESMTRFKWIKLSSMIVLLSQNIGVTVVAVGILFLILLKIIMQRGLILSSNQGANYYRKKTTQ